MPVKIGLVSLGCPKNLVDSEVMMGYLAAEGFEITPHKEEAEILIVNTCGFIGPAKEESIRAILEMAEMKKQGRCRKLLVAGCLTERYQDEIRQEMPEIDGILGVRHQEEILKLCSSDDPPSKRQKGLAKASGFARKLSTPAHYAYLKIAEGCSHECSFCVIPNIRGRHHSRTLSSLVQEAQQLAAQGVRELILVSQDTTAYGSDLGIRHGLAKLLKKLAGIEGIRWIRFLYAYPSTLENEVLEVMADEPKVCRYLDLPLQHVHRRILRDMGRGGTRHSLERLIGRIRKRIPDVALRTAMIVGYPGETAQEFQELMEFCRDIRFDHLGVFLYSEEEGTPAADQGPKIASRIAEGRRHQLMKQQEKISRRNHQKRIGQTVEIILDGPSAESDWIYQGRMKSQAPEIDGMVLINDSRIEPLQAGNLYLLKITRALAHDLIGTILSPIHPSTLHGSP